MDYFFKSQKYTSNFENNKIRVKNTHREKAPSSKTPTPSKSANTNIWAVGTSNQLSTGGS